MRIGNIELTPLVDGDIRIRPADAYPKASEADWTPHRRWLTHDGMLEMPIGCFLVRTGGRTVLVDAGFGPYQAGGLTGGRLLDELAAAGCSPEDVTDVVLTHLHFDHVGWATQKGQIVFPNATYRCHRADWDHFTATDPGALKKLSPLAGRLEAWDGAATIAGGLDTLPTPGHTPGHTALVVSSGAERIMLLGDAVHCPMELEDAEWEGMSDVDPGLARRTRESLMKELEETGTPAAAAHFPGLRFGRLLRGRSSPSWVVD